MATTLKLRTDIKKLKGALSSKSLPAPIKAKLKAQLDKAQNELKAMQSGAKPRKVSTTKGTQTALTSLQKLVSKKKFSVYQGKGIDLKKDADQGALAIGYRVSKGIKGNQFGDAKSSKGNVYYEYRANRLDVKQPKGKQKYPKLEDGGMMARGGKIPSNVEEFAKRKGISSMVSKIAGWAEKAGKKITGGTAIGKNYDTLILDLSYQDNAIYIDIEDGTITIYDEVVNNFNSFKNAIEKHKMAKGGELKVSTYHLMPLVMTNDKMMVPKYDNIITFEGTEDEALAKAKDMLNKEVVNVHVSLINPNAKSLLNRRKTIAVVKDKMAHGGKTQGYDDKEDERLGMEYGKMSSKDLNSTHARRDDARFEERMAKGGNIEGEWAVLIGKRKKRILKKGMTKEEAKNYMKEYSLKHPKISFLDDLELKYMAKGGEVRFVDEFTTEDGIEISTAKTDDGKTLYGAQVTMYPLQKIIPFTSEDKNVVVERAKEIQSEMIEYLSKNEHRSDKLNQRFYAKGGEVNDVFFDKKSDVKFKFSPNENIKVLQYDNGKLKKLGATIFERYSAEQNDGTYYPFYWVIGDWQNNEDGKKHPLLYSEGELINRHGNKPKKMEDGGYMAKGGKTKEEPMVVRGYFEDEAYEYKDGGYVAVSETSDGYWYIMSKPSTKENAELLIKMGVARGEVGKVVTIEEAKKHGKLVGKEYLERGGYMAKRGSIPNNYKGKTANEIWDEWTFQQKRHFLEDHYDEIEKYGGLTMGKSLRSVAESTYNDLPTNVKQVLEDHIETGQYAQGGVTEKEVVESNAEMVLSKIKEVHHHADELGDIVTNKSDIEAWVVAKIERASTDLSDITHYLDGQHEKMSMGGSINNYVHKMDKK